MSKDESPKIDWKAAKEAQKMFQKDAEGEKPEEEIETNYEQHRQEMYHERLADMLKHPQRIMIEQEKLDELLASGEAIIPHVHLYDRELKPGEKVILEDENLKELVVEFVDMKTKGTSVYGAKVRVRLVKPE